MKTKEQIITDMCYTFRHDYGLRKQSDPGGYTFPFEAGMTEEEAIMLYKQMEQIYNNDIEPLLKYYDDLHSGNSVVLPKDKEHAEAMVKVGTFYLEQKNAIK